VLPVRVLALIEPLAQLFGLQGAACVWALPLSHRHTHLAGAKPETLELKVHDALRQVCGVTGPWTAPICIAARALLAW
jgi:hypothetical protein